MTSGKKTLLLRLYSNLYTCSKRYYSGNHMHKNRNRQMLELMLKLCCSGLSLRRERVGRVVYIHICGHCDELRLLTPW